MKAKLGDFSLMDAIECGIDKLPRVPFAEKIPGNAMPMFRNLWDANTVTHVLGVRAFGTQLLCEQVIGRALRRQSYELNEDGPNKGLFNVEYRREDAKEKKSTMDTYWIPGVNNLGTYGRWAFAEFTDIYQIESDFKAKVEQEFNAMIDSVLT